MIIYHRARKKTVQITKKTPSEDFHLPISVQRKARYRQISNNNNINNRKQKKMTDFHPLGNDSFSVFF